MASNWFVKKLRAKQALSQHIAVYLPNIGEAYDVFEQTRDIVGAYAFRLADWLLDTPALVRMVRVIKGKDESIPIVLDAGFGGVGEEGGLQADFALEVVGADAVTINPYPGLRDVAEPFLAHPNRGVFVIAKTGNRHSGTIQGIRSLAWNELVCHQVCGEAANLNEAGNVGLVCDVQFTGELRPLRDKAGLTTPIFVPDLALCLVGEAAKSLSLEGAPFLVTSHELYDEGLATVWRVVEAANRQVVDAIYRQPAQA